MGPRDFKRKYRYKSDTSSVKYTYWIAIIISIILFWLLWTYL
jgi:hypothetical protein